VAVGFDVVEHATNHIDDHGYDYISGTLDYWKTKHPEITVLGIHESQEDADSIKIREVNGIKVGFLDYTYGTNNINNVGPAYMIDTFMDGSEHIASLVKKAKEEADSG
jgi:poly-gamma-glutamate synthesis protein (capsule biosynthesis protein)